MLTLGFWPNDFIAKLLSVRLHTARQDQLVVLIAVIPFRGLGFS